jgi:predicted transcriptional regulator
MGTLRKAVSQLLSPRFPPDSQAFSRDDGGLPAFCRAHAWEITVRSDVRGGRLNIRAGQEEAHCRPITYEERKKIWREAVERERATRKKGCHDGDIGKAGLAVLHSLLFDFLNMKTGVCFPCIRTLQERLQPWFSRASIFRALNRLEAAGVVVRVSRRMRNAGKVVQGASLYVFAKFTEVEQAMAQKMRKLVKIAARAVRPVLWPRRPSESQSAPVPAENLFFRSGKRGNPALEASPQERAGIGLQMKALLASLRAVA